MPSADPSDYGRAKYSENRDFTRGRAGSAWKIERDISGLEAKFVTRWINEIFSADQRIFRHSQSNKMEIRLITILHTIDIANHVPNWINLLVRLITIVDAAADFRELKDNFEKASRSDDVSFYGSLF
jgi:hypothetical protein